MNIKNIKIKLEDCVTTMTNIDLELESFLSSNNDEDLSDDDTLPEYELLSEDDTVCAELKSQPVSESAPNPTDIYISTKTKIAYLNRKMDLKRIFWEN